MWQIGPLSRVGKWEWHSAELESAEFGIVLLAELEDFLQSISANWLEIISARTVIALTSRLLASATDPKVVSRAYALLRQARDVTFGWMHQLVKKQQDKEDIGAIQEFQRRACEVAATCRETFDVDPAHARFLLNSSRDVAILVECAIVVHDNTPPTPASQKDSDFFRLLDRDRRLSHSLESLLARQISHCRDGLDSAILAIWAGYRSGHYWTRHDAPNNRWVTTMTAAEGLQVSQAVQYNLLDGCLLINGKPLGRLPKEMMNNALYARIFGTKILDVVPADVPGMDFATRDLISNHQVLFGFKRDESTLIIRAKYGSEILELVPHGKFINDLPRSLVEHHVHWLNLSDQTIEVRPIANLWVSSDDNWWIHFPLGQNPNMCKGGTLLIDIRSPTMHMVSELMAPLEYMRYLTVTYSPEGCLSVDLPRFRLSFFLNKRNELESRNMPGMIIDADRSSGTMIGLFNQLVLRRTETDSSRRVLIPNGDVHFEPNGDHVKVTVDTTSQTHVRYHGYHIDSNLGRLAGDTSLISTLYQIYLHAVTSHCLPDPLTGRTGTEEALNMLSSAGCFSFQSLGPAEAGVLARISDLTPDRKFYPDHLKVMQTVTWSNLTPIAQHPSFHSRSQFILDYAERLSVFNRNSMSGIDITLSNSNPLLLERAQHLMKVLYPDDVADPQNFNNDDVVHAARHFHEKSPDEGVAATVSSLVHSWPSRLTTCRQLLDVFQGWGTVSGPNEGISIAYSRAWINPDLSQVWLSLYSIFRGRSKARDQYELSFNLAVLAYSSPGSRDRDLISTILAFATVPQFSTMPPPPWQSYNLYWGFQSTIEDLFEAIKQHAVSFEDSPEASLPAHSEEDEHTLWGRRRSTFNDRVDSQAQELASHLNRQWPCRVPKLLFYPSNSGDSWLFDMPNLKEDVEGAFLIWYQNSQLRDHIRQVQAILNEPYSANINPNNISVHSFTPCSASRAPPSSSIFFDHLFQRRPPAVGRSPSSLGISERFIGRRVPTKTYELRSLLTEFRRETASVFQQRYGHDLDQSRQSLSKTTSISLPSDAPYPLFFLEQHLIQHRQHFHDTLGRIIASLSPSSTPEGVMLTSGHWPRLTVRTLLGKLAFGSRHVLGDQWLQVLIALAEALLGLQRSHRLLALARSARLEELYAELQNQSNNVQNGKQYPDWLLIQVENDFLARPVQVQVAQEMISPRSKQNTALQLNMGEGKSSVIVPMVATALSNGHRFVRVVVLKPLATQMFQLLVKRLSGLANRRIFYMPFSRGNSPSSWQVDTIQKLKMECMHVGGILVAQPEHILSFKLMGIDRLFCAVSFEGRQIANRLLDSQRWLEENSRDILDESDELLYVKYQLVYTSGQQQAMEDHPDRWTTLQQILALFHKHAPRIKQQFPSGMEVEDVCQGSYPHIRITQPDAGGAIISLIARDVMMGMLPNCSFGLLPAPVRQAALRFITQMAIDDDDQQLLQGHCVGTGSWNALLLLRGLLALGILVYVLKERRWRVDYGLDPRRSLLAVPYKAKDVPSLRAEFGHPDVTIALTSLSYHYQGLSPSQVNQCFELLYKLDNPTLEYEKWVSNNNSIPDDIRRLSGVNTQDPEQRRDIFPLFNRNHAVIDFFLSQVVFPKEAKEFPKKLGTSAWDLAETKRYLTTGFSGTNDRRYLLPTSIVQDDPIDQLGTNAKVLTYLLQPENNHYLCVHSDGQRLATEDFLRLLTESPEIRVLLDVGAQMLGLQNKELARYWLSLTPPSEVSAAIYFEENDELTVLSRDGSIEAFMSSPFNQQLDKCLVYLDDSHTRGTDLKLPRTFRAAVTLGPKVTKDRLLQGCMRMRKLGHGQSVMIFAPLEVDRGIREAAKKFNSDKIVALDILRWVMLETCKDIEHHFRHWFEQGFDYYRRRGAWDEFSKTHSSLEELESVWLQPESRTLDAMYGFNSVDGSEFPFDDSVPEIRARCQELGFVSLHNARMDEEQEREVQHEVEREREVERPPKVKPAEHKLHPHVREMVTSGWFDSKSTAFVSILSPLSRFAAASPTAWSPYLLATKDFSTTVQGKGATSGDYLRLVIWIVSCALPKSYGTVFVALSPYEVNELLPALRKSKAVHLHQYSPKVARSMKPLDDLAFYCVPQLTSRWRAPGPSIITQLNLWAGQLYFPDEATYLRLCHFLGIYTPESLSADEMPIQNDGFIKPEHRGGSLQVMSPFTESPIPFLKELIGFRRKGMGYLSTPLGKILHAKLLTDDDFKG